ncbi:MAG: DNRLRE domain-containing protein [Nitrososphaerota archaeon]|nr:DNRLRE domain-containing protein [Nitrososphaerota archaeon]
MVKNPLCLLIILMLLILPTYLIKNAESTQTLISRVFSPSHDAVVYEGDPERNFGSHASIGVNYRIGFRDRSFLMFDLKSLPPGSTIVSATLNLYMYDAPNSSRTIACNEIVEESWDELGINWNNQPKTTIFLSSVSTGTRPKKLSFEVKESLVKFTAKDEFDYSPNYGWMLKDINETIGDKDDPLWICSKEHPDSDKRPYLEVKFYPPRLELIIEDSSVEAGTWVRITVYRKTSNNEPITRGKLRVKLSSNSTSMNKRFSLTPGGAEITELTIPTEESSVKFYYYDEKAGIWKISVWTDEYTDYIGDSKILRIRPGPLHSFGFEYISSPKIMAAPFPITVVAYDVYGNIKTDYTGQNTLLDTTGTIEPKTIGKFKDGKWTGNVTINRTGRNIKIITMGEGKIGESNSFDVTIGPPSRLKIVPSEFAAALGVVYSHLNISLTDAGGSESPTTTDILVNLSTNSPHGEFRDYRTGEKITSVVIPAGKSTVFVDYYDTAYGTWILTASAKGFEAGEARVSIKPDTSPPEIEIRISDPKYETPSRIYVSGSTIFYFYIKDDLSGVMEVKYKINDGPWNSYHSDFNLSAYAESLHVITYFGVDKAGNKGAEKNISVIVDKTSPIVEKAFPLERLFSNSMIITFVVKVNDTISGVKEVELFVNGISQGLMNISRGEYIKTVKLSEGYHNWSIKVTDKVDNLLYSNYSFTLLIDAKPPTILEISQSQAVFGESVVVNSRVYDEASGVRAVYLYYSTDKGSTWMIFSMMPQDNTYTGSIPSQFLFTEVQYYVEVIDNAGNRYRSNLFKYTVGIPPWLYSIIALLIAIGIYVFFIRRFFARGKNDTCNLISSDP